MQRHREIRASFFISFQCERTILERTADIFAIQGKVFCPGKHLVCPYGGKLDRTILQSYSLSCDREGTPPLHYPDPTIRPRHPSRKTAARKGRNVSVFLRLRQPSVRIAHGRSSNSIGFLRKPIL
jgi:hypothetical protein